MTESISSAVPGPETIHDVTLDNGLRVLVRENHSSPAVVVNGYLPGGAVVEPADQAGLSAFTASMVMRGTETRSFEQINDAVESVGASLSVYSGRHAVGVSGKSLAEDFPMLLEVLADVLRSPAFPLEHVERVRGQRLTALQERDNDTRSVASLLFRSLAYPADHPYSRPVDGYAETIGAIDRQALLDFYGSTFGPAGGVLVIVGAVRAQDAVAEIDERLGEWRASTDAARALPAVSAPSGVVRQEQVLDGKTQSDIVLGVPALRRDHPDFYAARLANTILGRFGMMGRLGENVRERRGLAYYSYSVLEAGKAEGPWMVSAGVNPANVAQCLEAINEELQRLGTELVPHDELGDSQAFLTGSLPLQLETNEGVARVILDMAWYDLGLDYLQHYPELIRGVTAEQVREVSARFFRPEAYAVAIAGPALEK